MAAVKVHHLLEEHSVQVSKEKRDEELVYVSLWCSRRGRGLQEWRLRRMVRWNGHK